MRKRRMSALLLALGLSCVLGLREVRAEGMLADPVSRSGVWRLNQFEDAPVNEKDHETNCGGVLVYQGHNHGKCGPCGDDFSKPRPRPNENGGLYGRGNIVRKYEAGQMINVVVDLRENKRGRFAFALCPLSEAGDVETEECFDRHPVKVTGPSGVLADEYDVEGLSGQVKLSAILPKELRCARCALRWQYVAGNNWGRCEDGTEAVGCGKQEMYRNCADIAIK